MADTSPAPYSRAQCDMLRDISRRNAEIDAAIADMNETIIRTRSTIDQSRKLLRSAGSHVQAVR